VTLKDGSNVITVLATDDEGFVSSRSVVIHRTAKGIARLDEK
jgi:hypothetical protein